MQAEKFVSLTKKEAQDLAERMNLIFRLIRVDDRNLQTYPEDLRDDRVCIELDKGHVTKATLQ